MSDLPQTAAEGLDHQIETLREECPNLFTTKRERGSLRVPRGGEIMKRYDEHGGRTTDCCGVYSTYDEHGTLYCKKCYEAVGVGQGDGAERKGDDDAVAHLGHLWGEA